MTGTISRRSLLAAAGCIAAGPVAGQGLAVAHAGQVAAPAASGAAICLTMLFESDPKARFDRDKYTKKHLPLLHDVYGDSVERIELRAPASSGMGPPPALLAATLLYIRDVPAFSQKLAANADRINKDLDSLAQGNRLVQPDRIVLSLGDARSEVPANTDVFSLYFRAMPAGFAATPVPDGGPPSAAGVSASTPAPGFDTRFFVESYLPKLHAMYGADALRRLEATIGMDQGGRKATQIAAYHLFIRDRKAYDTASRTVFTEMQQDGGKLMQGLMPVFADMRINATV
jgi:hypothetical protein